MIRRNDLLLAVLLFLSLLIILATEYWSGYKSAVAEKQFLSVWHDEATGLAQQFKANHSVVAQMRRSIQKIQKKLDKSGILSGQEKNRQHDQVRAIFDACMPEGWFNSSTQIYFFRLGSSDGECLTGKGLARSGGAFLARIFAGIQKWESLSAGEQKKIDSRLEKLFGERTTAEMFIDNRGGHGINVIFNGESRVVFWDFLTTAEGRSAAFMMVAERRPGREDAAMLTLKQVSDSSVFRSSPILMPVNSLAGQLRPIMPESQVDSGSVKNLLKMLEIQSDYSQIASFSVPAICKSLIVQRTVFSRDMPYEFWLVCEKPEFDKSPVTMVLRVFFAGAWFLTAMFRFRNGPFHFSLSSRLLGLISVVGGLPVLAVLFIGMSVIEFNDHSRYRNLISQVRREISEIDEHSTSQRNLFESIVRRQMNDSAFKRALLTEDNPPENLMNKYFEEFSAAGVPLNGLGLLRFGRADRMIFPPGYGGSRNISRLLFFSPMIYTGLRYFSEKTYKTAIESLSESQRLGYDTYMLVTTSSILNGVALARQKSFVMEFGEVKHYACYDYISDGENVVGAVVYFARAFDAYSLFARNAISRAADRTGRAWAIAENRGDTNNLVVPAGTGSQKLTRWLLKNLAVAHDSNSWLVKSSVDDMMVCVPCRHMQGISIGSCVSLKEHREKTRSYYQALFAGTAVLGFLLFLVAAGTKSFFLSPLKVIESGISRILAKEFSFQLLLQRDDELGDVAETFNQMAKGLNERYELAQFVSGSLSSRLDEISPSERNSETRWGVVLASDIRSFTTLSETWPAEMIVEMLNRHLELMSSAIIEQKGEIDKFIGDAIIAAFFARTKEEACALALAAARKMMLLHRQFTEERIQAGKFAYGMGVGLAAGELEIGFFSAGERHEYIMTGEARRLAEDLEAESKMGRMTHIVFSEEIHRLIPDIACRKLHEGIGFEVAEL